VTWPTFRIFEPLYISEWYQIWYADSSPDVSTKTCKIRSKGVAEGHITHF